MQWQETWEANKADPDFPEPPLRSRGLPALDMDHVRERINLMKEHMDIHGQILNHIKEEIQEFQVKLEEDPDKYCTTPDSWWRSGKGLGGLEMHPEKNIQKKSMSKKVAEMKTLKNNISTTRSKWPSESPKSPQSHASGKKELKDKVNHSTTEVPIWKKEMQQKRHEQKLAKISTSKVRTSRYNFNNWRPLNNFLAGAQSSPSLPESPKSLESADSEPNVGTDYPLVVRCLGRRHSRKRSDNL